jgi:hypothetical protein
MIITLSAYFKLVLTFIIKCLFNTKKVGISLIFSRTVTPNGEIAAWPCRYRHVKLCFPPRVWPMKIFNLNSSHELRLCGSTNQYILCRFILMRNEDALYIGRRRKGVFQYYF